MSSLLKEARATLQLAMPIILGSVGQIGMGVIDSLMLGRVGKEALAGAAFGNSIFGFFYIVSLGLLLPLPVFIARAHGAGQIAHCAQWLKRGLELSILIALVGFGLMIALSLKLELFGQPPEILAIVRPFYLLIAVSLLPALVFQVFRQHAEALGRPLVPMFILLAGVALNTALNYLLIYGNWGFPALGLSGAGLATLLARSLSLVALILYLRAQLRGQAEWPWSKDRSQLKTSLPEKRRAWAELLAQGIPTGGQLLFELIAFTASAIMMGWLGTQALAAHQIALSCGSLTFMFPLGIATASSIRIGKALGAGETTQVRRIGLASFGTTWVLMTLFGLSFLLFGRTLAKAYIDEPIVINLAAQLLAVGGLFQLFDGTQVVGAGVLRGLGDVRIPTLITAAAYVGLAVPISYFLGVRPGYPAGIWMGLAFGLAFAAAALFRRYLHKSETLAQT